MRRGLKITPGYKEADLVEFDEYMKYAKDFYERYFLINPDKFNIVPKTIFLVSEEPNIITESSKK